MQFLCGRLVDSSVRSLSGKNRNFAARRADDSRICNAPALQAALGLGQPFQGIP